MLFAGATRAEVARLCSRYTSPRMVEVPLFEVREQCWRFGVDAALVFAFTFSSDTPTLTHSQLAAYRIIDTKRTNFKSRLEQASSIMDDELDEDTLQALALSMQEVLCLCARHWRASLQRHVVNSTTKTSDGHAAFKSVDSFAVGRAGRW